MSFDLASIPQWTPPPDAHWSGGEPAAPADPNDITLADNPNLLTRASRRRFAELTKRADAAQQIAKLPRTGEVLHLRMDGSFNGVELVEALVQLAPQVGLLTIATLSYNRRVAERLLELIDTGAVKSIDLVVSAMMEGRERSTIDWVAAELARRGSRQIIARNHQKLVLIEAGRRRIVCAGSQNLRTCRCYEQADVTSSGPLYDWHRAHIERMAAAEAS